MLGPRQVALFYDFNLKALVSEEHLLRSIGHLVDLSGVRAHLAESYSSTGCPPVDLELMIPVSYSLIVGQELA